MAVPKVNGQFIAEAVKYIDENGVPWHNTSTKYELVWENGNTYPPKYVIAVANHLQNNAEIDVSGYNAVEAKNYLINKGYEIQTKQTKWEITITDDGVTSTDDSFTMDNINAGDKFKPLDTYFVAADGTVTRRVYEKGERRNTNQTLPRIAFQIYEKQIAALPVEEKEQFPICQYSPDKDVIRGIYYSKDEAKAHNIHPINTMRYNYGDGRKFVIYSWNLFTTLRFVQECLKRFGNPGDAFKLIYREKDEKENAEEETVGIEEVKQTESRGYRNQYSNMLVESKNIIFHGAPGTGKTYLAREIAADIISDGYYDDYTMLSDEQKQQIEFVQFHPSYDYSDFVEGLRPKINRDGSMGFELQDGIFKKFVDKARRNYDNSKKYVFIIDEINRGEISKIFGELFFAVDPGYRGIAGEVSTQYANLHADSSEMFYIPDNVYIIGTMNDIDRSVDSFDFAMRRRFRFVELRADDCLEMLSELNDEEKEAEAIRRMSALNTEIANTEGLNENYQIGASYFLKLKSVDFEQLWTDYLNPLLQEYINGMYDEEGIMERFRKAYEYGKSDGVEVNEPD